MMNSNLLIVYFPSPITPASLLRRSSGKPAAHSRSCCRIPYPASYRAVVQRGQEELHTGNLPPCTHR